MLSEVLRIDPQLDPASASKMEQSLGKRFTKLAKSFGSGIKTALLGGGGIAVATAIIDKILNPLQQTQEAIDKILNRSSDLQTYARQFGSTPENLFKLETLAQAKGVSPEEIRLMLLKFQQKIVEYKADTSQPSVVAQFADEKDQVNSFFKFIQRIQNLEPNAQHYVQQDVFGEKLILKMSEFMQTKDFAKLASQLNLPSGPEFSRNLNTAGAIKDVKELVDARLEAGAFADQVKALAQRKDQLTADNALSKQIELTQDTKRIESYDNLKRMQQDMEVIKNKLEDAFTRAAKYLPDIVDAVGGLARSRAARGASKNGKGE